MPDTQLIINVGGSSFAAELDNLQHWQPFLNTADSIAIHRLGEERLRVDLGGLKRWITFEKTVGGSPLVCIGWQETVGATYVNGFPMGGSNRKVLAWLYPNGRVYWGDKP